MGLFFQLKKGFTKDGDICYIPYGCGKVGYICMGYLGIPLGMELFPEGETKYWIGSDVFSWVCDGEMEHIATVRIMSKVSSRVTLAMRFWDMVSGDVSYNAVYDMRKGQYQVYPVDMSLPSVSGMLHCVPQHIMAKYLLMS